MTASVTSTIAGNRRATVREVSARSCRPAKYLLALLLPGACTLAADQQDFSRQGQTAASFLEMNPSVRMAALGGDQCAVSGDSDALFSNQAGLARLPVPQLYITHNESMLNTRYENAALAWPTKRGVWAGAFQYVNDGSFDRTQLDSAGNPVTGLGHFQSNALMGQAAWARTIGRMSLGLGAKAWQESLENLSQRGWAVDAGWQMAAVLPRTTLAVALRNVGPASGGARLPGSTAVGLEHEFGACRYLPKSTLLAEGDVATYRPAVFRAGYELSPGSLRLRVGVNSERQELGDELSRFGFGVGVVLKGWSLDYAWLSRGLLGSEQRVALRLAFGLTPEERLKAAQELDDAMADRMKARAKAAYQEGQAAMDKGQWEEASRSFGSALEWDPSLAAAKSALKTAREKVRQDEARRQYENGVALANDGEWMEAALHWEEALRLFPEHLPSKKMLEKAKKMVQSSGDSRTSAAEDAFSKGIFHFLNNEPKEALAQWERVAKLNPDKPHLREYIEKAKRLAAEQDLARLQQKVKSGPEQDQRAMQQAYTLYTLGQVDKAIELWEALLRRSPHNQDAQLALRQAQAKRSLLAGTEISPVSEKVRGLNAQAMSAYVDGDLATAASFLRQALALDPGNLWLRNSLNRIENESALQAN